MLTVVRTAIAPGFVAAYEDNVGKVLEVWEPPADEGGCPLWACLKAIRAAMVRHGYEPRQAWHNEELRRWRRRHRESARSSGGTTTTGNP